MTAPRASAARFPWRDSWPGTAVSGDGNGWLTGGCWLYCGRREVPVLWVGSVHTPGAIGELYACGGCLAEIALRVRHQALARDAAYAGV
ncbi:hypothetical protein ABZ714_01390 [Streptomyces sp. NPDC006798]|uniref:hypothetical protein n=1 Tax=Streptomyces sp. NPDC006798 TaxID=3155462 RepID=UPI00340C93B8